MPQTLRAPMHFASGGFASSWAIFDAIVERSWYAREETSQTFDTQEEEHRPPARRAAHAAPRGGQRPAAGARIDQGDQPGKIPRRTPAPGRGPPRQHARRKAARL